MAEETLKQVWAFAQPGKARIQRLADLLWLSVLTIPHPLFDIAMAVFFRVQFRCIRRQILHLNIRVTCQVVLYLATAMDRSVVPNENDGLGNMPT